MTRKLTPTHRALVALLVGVAVVLLLGGGQAAEGADAYTIDTYRGGSAFDRGGGCSDAMVRIRAGNSWTFPILVGTMTTHWCYRDGHLLKNGSFSMNTWGDATFGFSYDGVISVVKGGCLGPGCNHVYRRVYFQWSRDFQGIGQFTQLWVAITMRANGTCTMDRSGLEGTVDCGAVAGGGGGGGSW